METVVGLGGFVKANLYREENSENVWVAHYQAQSAELIRKYLAGPSQEMRADALAR